jgi:hypothetical protein
MVGKVLLATVTMSTLGKTPVTRFTPFESRTK